MKAAYAVAVLVLLVIVWWQTDSLSEIRTRNKLLTETAIGYGQVIEEMKATTLQTHKLLAELKARDQQRNDEGERRREEMRTAISGDTCAVSVVPDAVSHSLQNRATRTDHTAAP
ncbi:DUF2570 domain-containing protein [Klebsiella grimontii]|uniref:DUF2570 domain-containing protein n=1 Tax=Klebsiella grimontii TaxID=2058152 RepID=UPI001CCB65D2|nr:DUF2570 domain-containing protein [Klebsiella grimontii]MBZ7473367.1 DUF2570 domain-containing protein [Klebsiella grimontii]